MSGTTGALPLELAGTGNWGPSANLNGTAGTQQVGSGVMPGEQYASGQNMQGLIQGIPGTYQTQNGPVSINKFGVQPTSFPVPSGFSSALPPTTSNGNGGGGGTQPSSYDQRLAAWRAAGNTGDMPVGWNPTSGGSNSNQNLPTIDDLFGGEMGFLEGLKPTISADQSAALKAANDQYTGQQTNINNQTNQLNNQLGIDTNNFNYGLNSAYSQAQNAYNQLLARNLALYGGGSSAGGAIASILGQGYQQQTGGLSNQDLAGHQQLGQQGQNIKTWSDSQLNTLMNWKNQAETTINTQAQQALAQINQQEGMAQDAKTNAKLGVLQDLINQKQALDAYHTQLASQLAAISAMQGPSSFGVSGYNPGNYSAIMGALNSSIAQSPLQLQNQMAQSAGLNPQQASQFVGNLFNGFMPGQNNTQDQLMQLGGQGFVPNSNSQQQQTTL